MMNWLSGHLAYFNAHPELYTLLVWPALTALLSFGQKQIAARAPRIAAFLVATGLDVPHVMRIIASFFPGAPPPPAASGGDGDAPKPPSNVVSLKRERLSEDRFDRLMRWALGGVFVAGTTAIVLAFVMSAVAACTPQQRQEVHSVIDTVLSADEEACVVEKALGLEVLSHEAAVIVAAQCDIAPPLLSVVERLIGATKVAQARHEALGHVSGPDAGAPAANDNERRPAAGYR